LPEVDFMIVCDYVRADQGVLHMIAAGVDRVFASEVPTGRNVGIGIRLLLTRNECGRPHQLELIFQDEDGVRLTEFTGQFVAGIPSQPARGTTGQRRHAAEYWSPLPRYGGYSIELLIDGNHKTEPPSLGCSAAGARGRRVIQLTRHVRTA